MIFLDTHVAAWLYEGAVEKLSKKAIELIEENFLLVSAMTVLELQFLYEVKRLAKPTEKILTELQQTIDLEICDLSFGNIIKKANEISWTRDPFDRIIVANAMARKCPLLTKDRNIRKHYTLAVW